MTRASIRRIQAVPNRVLPIRSVRPDPRTVRTDPIRSRAAAIRVRFRSDASDTRSDGPDPSDTRSARPNPSDPIRATPSVPPGPSDRPAQPRSVCDPTCAVPTARVEPSKRGRAAGARGRRAPWHAPSAPYPRAADVPILPPQLSTSPSMLISVQTCAEKTQGGVSKGPHAERDTRARPPGRPAPAQ